MNETRRRVLRKCINAARCAKKSEELNDVMAELQDIMDEEEESRDNIPESLQDSDRYYDSEAASESMDEAMASLEEALGYLEEVENEGETADTNVSENAAKECIADAIDSLMQIPRM